MRRVAFNKLILAGIKIKDMGFFMIDPNGNVIGLHAFPKNESNTDGPKRANEFIMALIKR
jgi:hypothetical protein